MADPIVEQIRQNLMAAVATVTTDNNYTGTLTVEAVQRHGNSAAGLTAIVEQGEEEVLGEEDDSGSVGHHTFWQTFHVFINIANPANVADYDRLCNLASADVRKAVMADVSRGGLALRTKLVSRSIFANEAGEVAGTMVPFDVLYRTKLDDPFTL